MVLSLRVKLIASLGPSSCEPDIIEGLALAGASGFRVNFSHGDPGSWSKLVDGVRKVEERLGKALTLITDLRGSSIRLGDFPSPIRLKEGDVAVLTLDEFSFEGRKIPLPNPKVLLGLEEGDIIVMDDGRVRLRVSRTRGREVEVVALTDAVIKPHKGLVVQDKEFDLPSITDKDLRDLQFACTAGADYIGLSYVRSAKDVVVLRQHLKQMGCKAKIIAKIETKSAVRNLDSIIEVADVILVARGDLGMNYGLEEIPRLQKHIVRETIRRGKPVIIATQLLESMINNPVPTRAEVVDVSNAVREGVDALMLTGETAIGKYPIEAVKWLRKIAEKAEQWGDIRIERAGGPLKRRYAKGVAELAEDLGAKLVIFSMAGNTARFIASIRPKTDLYVGVPSIEAARSINILWGVEPLIIDASTYSEGLEKTYNHLIEVGHVKLGDLVVLTYGMRGDEQVIKVRRYV